MVGRSTTSLLGCAGAGRVLLCRGVKREPTRFRGKRPDAVAVCKPPHKPHSPPTSRPVSSLDLSLGTGRWQPQQRNASCVRLNVDCPPEPRPARKVARQLLKQPARSRARARAQACALSRSVFSPPFVEENRYFETKHRAYRKR